MIHLGADIFGWYGNSQLHIICAATKINAVVPSRELERHPRH